MGPQTYGRVNNAMGHITQGKPVPGGKGGRCFENREGKLPKTDKDGKPIDYKEWDVNPQKAGQPRDAERIVTGSDGSAYYTNDHYGNFQYIPGVK
jgi:ribonuclease T1